MAKNRRFEKRCLNGRFLIRKQTLGIVPADDCLWPILAIALRLVGWAGPLVLVYEAVTFQRGDVTDERRVLHGIAGPFGVFGRMKGR
jgi:hypothetical protein